MHYIEFPKLGIRFDLNPEIFTIGIFHVHWYGVIMALAFLIVVIGVIKDAPKFDLNQDHMIDLVLVTVPVGILGARLFYVIVNWEYYSVNLSEIYKTWNGGMAIYGGIILGLIAIYLFCRIKKISALHVLDHITVYLVLGQVIGRWGNFINQELFGPNTDLPWGMTGDIIQTTIAVHEFEGVDPYLPVHPLFLYESLWSLATFFLLLWFRKKKKQNGEVLSLYMISYGLARFVIDSMRFDLKVGNVNINRLIGITFVIAFAAFFIIRRKRLKKESLEDASYQPSRFREIIDEMDDMPEDKEQEASLDEQADSGGISGDLQAAGELDESGELPDESQEKEKGSGEADILKEEAAPESTAQLDDEEIQEVTGPAEDEKKQEVKGFAEDEESGPKTEDKQES